MLRYVAGLSFPNRATRLISGMLTPPVRFTRVPPGSFPLHRTGAAGQDRSPRLPRGGVDDQVFGPHRLPTSEPGVPPETSARVQAELVGRVFGEHEPDVPGNLVACVRPDERHEPIQPLAARQESIEGAGPERSQHDPEPLLAESHAGADYRRPAERRRVAAAAERKS